MILCVTSWVRKACNCAQVHEASAGPRDEAGVGGADARTGAGSRGTIPGVPSSGPHQVDGPLLPLQAGLVEGL
jgi:hypothetical protein